MPPHFVLTCDHRYFPGLVGAMVSVLRNSTELEAASFHIVDCGLKDDQIEQLKLIVSRFPGVLRLLVHDIDISLFDDVETFRGSVATYVRLLLPEILDDVSEVLYLDVDVYYGADLQLLWRVPLGENLVVAVQDPLIGVLGNDAPWLDSSDPDRAQPYFNAGVLKLDLDACRRMGFTRRALKILHAEPENCRIFDQTVMNRLLVGKVVWLPDRFNFLVLAENEMDAGERSVADTNLHFYGGIKPWMQHSDRVTWREWRAAYRANVERFPDFMLSYRYWAVYLWREHVTRMRFFLPLCRMLHSTGAYRLVPGLTEDSLMAHIMPGEFPVPEQDQ